MSKMIVPKEEKKDPLIHRRIFKQPVNVNSIEAMTKETDKPVTGTFMNVEYPGQPGTVCALFYKGMEYFCKTFQDNETATIPLSVARYINERCYSEEHTHLMDEKGNPIKGNKRKTRYKFIIEQMAA